MFRTTASSLKRKGETKMKLLKSCVVVLGLAVAAPAMADTYIYTDPHHDFRISFPDSWTLQTPEAATGVVRIAGPLGEELPTCQVKAEPDGRIAIYPKNRQNQAVVVTLDQEFWQTQVNQYPNAEITEYRAPTSLGQGDATAVKAFYTFDGVQMYSTWAATIYAGTRYTMHCASRAEAYERWAPLFASIIGSFDLDRKYHPFAQGYYRDFLADEKIYIPRRKPGTTDIPPQRKSRWLPF